MARIAKDGKPFDIDNVDEEATVDEVEVIQFMRPDGKRRRMLATVGKQHVAMAEGMVLSCETLPDGKIALWARWVDEDEEKELCELAINGPGPQSPDNMLKKLIEDKASTRGHDKPKLCYNYHTMHPHWKGQPSYTCKGCTRREPLVDNIDGYVLKDGRINCHNFKSKQ